MNLQNNMHDKQVETLKRVISRIAEGDMKAGRLIIQCEYPFQPIKVQHRSYTVQQRMEQFTKDGFIDRYSGEKLMNPGILKIISLYYPKEFPYHPNWKMSESHIAYWEFTPTIDHIKPISAGGDDSPSNWVTTSMMNNMVKSNWTLEQLRWQMYPAGDIGEWDGLTSEFLGIVDGNKKLLEDKIVSTWYSAACKAGVWT